MSSLPCLVYRVYEISNHFNFGHTECQPILLTKLVPIPSMSGVFNST